MRKYKCQKCNKHFTITNPKTRNVKYCSAYCRQKFYYDKRDGAAYQREYNYNRRKDSIKNRIKCEICGKYYRQVGSHIVQVHKMTAREYREKYGFDVKRGQLPPDYRELKAQETYENGTIINLKKGKKYWFKKGQEGLGKYKRSQETMERLRNLHTYQKQ